MQLLHGVSIQILIARQNPKAFSDKKYSCEENDYSANY